MRHPLVVQRREIRLLGFQPFQRRGAAFGDTEHGVELLLEAQLQILHIAGAIQLQTKVLRAVPLADFGAPAKQRLRGDFIQAADDLAMARRFKHFADASPGRCGAGR